MQLDFRNINTLWSSVIVETLSRLGLTTAVICPGSRSTPLTLAFARHPHIETIPILDERSAAFFALGIAKRTHLPTALICTSGTAGANFYPAVIEAKESQVPLLIFTGDRPPELRNCHAGQTIDQVKLYSNYCRWYTELSLPSLDIKMLSYLRQTIITAWDHTLVPYRGVVHLNCPFREPLAPIVTPEINTLSSTINFDVFLQIFIKEIKKY
ncbi:2-succinyl-5-enolpyruvyl-6-hydroxy-3-cyclohexene-1-carboxylic-acid synthase [Crocosphaera watsonii WH 8502]|uniref:2-succinyl-5-enolpyruvyl-6-hydroxy-3-cyclohexene-1-carboxylic-acid synthase n=1 Tax=Crocosphaera watsonii WH 8502 TaxID=423474 RepID=T2IFG3_CROWT|nr:2-succinyl-5-enolpyruvyl-6-hydroxy-3-cyclohexene-1-carboxylic-acid synthase [Crocosphaera watsonii WH 8502]